MELIETLAVPDVFASGLAEVEDIGNGCYRLTFFALHRHGEHEERQVVARLIMAAEAIPKAIRMAARATHSCACAEIGSGTRH